jgi:DNA-binding CsgD family transcriptional regulator
LGIQSQLQFRVGRWRAAYAGAEEATRLATDTGQVALVAYTSGVLAEVEAGMGIEDQARAHAAATMAIADPVEAPAIGMYARSALGLLELGRGRAEEAVEPLRWCADASGRMGLREPNVHRWAPNLVEALIRSDGVDEAMPALERLEAVAESTGGAWARGCALRCRGLLEDADYRTLLGESAAVLEAAGSPFEAARSRLALGERLRRDRQRADAREPLGTAQRAFEQLGAAPWAERAGLEMEATGPSTARPRTRAEELTAHELRVALLVAEGRSNPQVAAELFISRKTVEFHLGQIYRKLGLRSRTELARLLAAELPAHPAEHRLRAGA